MNKVSWFSMAKMWLVDIPQHIRKWYYSISLIPWFIVFPDRRRRHATLRALVKHYDQSEGEFHAYKRGMTIMQLAEQLKLTDEQVQSQLEVLRSRKHIKLLIDPEQTVFTHYRPTERGRVAMTDSTYILEGVGIRAALWAVPLSIASAVLAGYTLIQRNAASNELRILQAAQAQLSVLLEDTRKRERLFHSHFWPATYQPDPWRVQIECLPFYGPCADADSLSSDGIVDTVRK